MRIRARRETTHDPLSDRGPAFVVYEEDRRLGRVWFPDSTDRARKGTARTAVGLVLGQGVDDVAASPVPDADVERIAAAADDTDRVRAVMRAKASMTGWPGAIRDSGGTDIADKCG